MRALWIAMLVLLPTLAGCMEPRRECTDGYPLVLQVHPSVMNASRLQGATYLWNCEDRPIVMRQSCLPGFPLYPRMVVDDVTYLVGFNASAIPEDAAPCTGVPEELVALEPGHSTQVGGYQWDGTILPPGAAEPVRLEGTYTWRVEVGGLVEEVEVEVPR